MQTHSKSMRILKILGWVLLVLFTILLIAALIVALTFNPNSYKPEIIENVRTHLGRELEIPGELRFSFFPPLTLESGQALLHEKGRAERFASVDKLRMRVALMPLFSKRLQIDALSIEGLSVEIMRDAQGQLNIDDLIPRGPSTLPAFFIDNVSLVRARVRFRDELSGGEYTLSGIEGSLTPFAPAQRGRLSLSGKLKLSDAAPQGRFDLASDFTFKAPGAALLLAKTQANWSLTTTDTSIASSVILDSVAVAENVQAGGSTIGLNYSRKSGATLSAETQLKLPAFEWKPGAAITLPVTLASQVVAGGWKGALFLDGNLDAAAGQPMRILALRGRATAEDSELKAAASLNGAAAYDASAGSATLQLSTFNLDVSKQQRALAEIRGALQTSLKFALDKAEAKFEGTLNASRATARFDIPLAAPERTHFYINLAKLDLERMPPGTSDRKKSGKSMDLDLAPLRALGISGELLIGEARSNGVTAKNLRIQVE